MSGAEEKYESPVRAILTGLGDLGRRKGEEVSLSPSDRLDGKKVLITGSSSGLGWATALELAQRGAEVIMAMRSGIPEKGDRIRRLSGSESVHMMPLDLTNLDSIPGFVSEVKSRFGHLDVFINNAAVVTRQSRRIKGGWDEMFAVNYLAPFILVNQLIDQDLLKAKEGRIPRMIFVASESHRNAAGFEWDSLGVFEPYGIKQSVSRYGYYKLLLVTMARELDRRVNTDGELNVSVFSLCPGPVNSNIAREAPRFFQPLLKLVFGVFFRSPSKASRPVLYFAASPEAEGKTGEYLFLMQRRAVDPKAADPENGRKLWEMSESMMACVFENPDG